MNIEEFKQNIDDLVEKKKILKEQEEVRTTFAAVCSAFRDLEPYVNYAVGKLGVEKGRAKYLTFVKPPKYTIIIEWTSSLITSKISVLVGGDIYVKTSYEDLCRGKLENMSIDKLQFLHDVFKTENRLKLIDDLVKDLCKRIEEDKLYLKWISYK